MQVLAERQQVAELREEALIRELFGKTYKTGPILVLWPKRRLTCCIQLSLKRSPPLTWKTYSARPPVGTPSASPGNQREAHGDPSMRPTAGAGNRDRLDVQARRASSLMPEEPPRCRGMYRRRTGARVTGFTRECVHAPGIAPTPTTSAPGSARPTTADSAAGFLAGRFGGECE